MSKTQTDSVVWNTIEKLECEIPCVMFRPQSNTDGLPLVYLLHGQFDTEEDWFGDKGQLADILREVDARPMILVMPFGAAQKTNPSRQQQDPGLKEFVANFARVQKSVQDEFGKGPRQTAILGISMGGRQALHLVLNGLIPEVSVLGVLSGKLQGGFAKEITDRPDGSKRALPPLKLYFHYCGSEGTDAKYLGGNEIVCKDLGGTLRTRKGGDHNWLFWRSALAEFFREFNEIIAPPAVAADKAPGQDLPGHPDNPVR